MSFMDGDVKDIFEVDREASGTTPQLSKDVIMGATVKVTRIIHTGDWVNFNTPSFVRGLSYVERVPVFSGAQATEKVRACDETPHRHEPRGLCSSVFGQE